MKILRTKKLHLFLLEIDNTMLKLINYIVLSGIYIASRNSVKYFFIESKKEEKSYANISERMGYFPECIILQKRILLFI